MFYKNARIFCSDFRFHLGAFEVKDGRFGAILPSEVPEDAIDLKGATVIPGLIDVHNHGNSGADFSDGDYEGLKRMAAYLAKNGITGFAPASMTLPYEVWRRPSPMPESWPMRLPKITPACTASRWKAPTSARRRRALRTANT